MARITVLMNENCNIRVAPLPNIINCELANFLNFGAKKCDTNKYYIENVRLLNNTKLNHCVKNQNVLKFVAIVLLYV